MWRRPGAVLQAALARLASSSSEAGQARWVPAEVAQLVSLRVPGTMEMPSDVQEAVEAAAKDSNRKMVKKRGQQLTVRLRQMSRTRHRGGVHPNLNDGPEEEEEGEEGAGEGGGGGAALRAQRAQRGKRRQSRHQQMSQLLQLPALVVDGEGHKLDVAALWPEARGVAAAAAAADSGPREAAAASASISDGGRLYDQPAVLAYAASRMPACYAALHRALSEVAAQRPGWRPVSVLDFGAGPGTAVWAAQQVWPQAQLDVAAVEPSTSMAWLGHEIQRAQWQRHEGAARQQAAALRTQQQRQQQGGGQEEGEGGPSSSSGGGSSSGGIEPQDSALEQQPGEAATAQPAVTAEEGLPVPPPRLRWLHRLPPRWGAGRSRQYDLVLAGYVLGELRSDEERSRIIESLWERTGGVLVLVEPGTPAGAGHIQRARTQLLQLEAASQQQGGGQRGQGQQRRRLQQQQQQGQGQGQQAGEGGGPQAQHVVAPCPHDGACPLEGRRTWCHFGQRFQRTPLQRASKAQAGVVPRTYQDERFSYVAVARGPRPPRPQQVRVAGSRVPLPDDAEEYAHMPPHLRPRKLAPSLAGHSGSEDDDEGEDAELDDQAKREILQSLLGDSDEEEDEEDEESAALKLQLMEELLASMLEGERQQAAQRKQERLAAAAAGAASSRQLSAAELEAAEGAAAVAAWAARVAGGEQPVDWGREDPAGLAAAQAASGGWSRVLRTPRKRGGHVTLDICAAKQDGGPGQAAEGQLLRQVLSPALSRRGSGGTAAYRLSRRLRWGDLWPHHFQDRLQSFEPPTADSIDWFDKT